MTNVLTTSPTFGLAATLLVYAGAKWIHGQLKIFLLHPVLVTIAVLIALLSLTGVSYNDYMRGGSIIAYFLGPAVVALGVPLYDQLTRLRSEALPALITTLFASAAGMVASVAPLLIARAPRELVVSLLPKSVTTPIAMEISRGLGGEPSLTAAMVVLTGVVGAVAGPPVMRMLAIGSRVAFGYGLGTASHGIGTARALETGELEGAASSLALCLNGIATALLAPLIVRVILP